jgi:hypothetical protein
MNRRDFGKQAAAAALAASIAGCGVSTIEGYINAVDTAVTGVLNLIGDSALAAEIQAAVNAVNAALTNWKSGTIPQEVIEALNALQAVLDTLPLSSKLTAAVGLAIAAIDAILTLAGAERVKPNALAPTKPRVHQMPTQPLKTHREFAKAWNKAIDEAGLPPTAKIEVPWF